MVGLLDNLLDPRGADQESLRFFPDPNDPGDNLVDYSGGVPIYVNRKNIGEKLDSDKKRQDEANPYVPASGAFPAVGGSTPSRLPVPGIGMLQGNIPVPAMSAPVQIRPAPEPVSVPVGAPAVPRETVMGADQDQGGQAPTDKSVDLTKQPFGMLSGIWKGIQNNSDLLLGLGAGMTGAPSWAQGFSRGFAGASIGAQRDYARNLQGAGQAGLYQSLRAAMIANGVPPQQAALQAVAATTNPELAKALIAQHISSKGQLEKLKDAFGNERIVRVSPYMTKDELDEANNVSAGGAADLSGGGGMMFAPGISSANFDHSKVGDDYLSQLSPEMQENVKNYLAGRSMPTGRQQMMQAIKFFATKYGNDIGMPADDSSLSQRRVWANSLGNTQSGVGLQAKGFKQGLEHFVKLSDNLVAMNLSNGLGLEPLAGAVNRVKNLTTSQQELVNKNDVIGQALAREMGNLFSKNGGGVHEAAETKRHISNSAMSSSSAAGALEGIDELMQGGLKTLEGRRDELFPAGNAPKGSNFMGPEQEKALEHIRNNIAILKGQRPAGTAAPASTAPMGPGTYIYQGPGKPVVRVQ